MSNFIFSLNAIVPIILTVLLGFFLQKIGFLNDNFNKTADTFVFRCALPVSLFRSIAGMDFYGDFDLRFCLFCFLGTAVMFAGVWAASWLLLKNKGQVGAFAQASARSSASILGVALATNIYGNAGMVPMMIMSAVPFFNVYSVLILSFSPQVDEQGHLLPGSHGLRAVKNACANVAKNPLAGLPFALLRLTVPTMIDGALKSIGNTATPIALLVVGTSLCGSGALKQWKAAAVSSLVKLFLLPAIFLPIAGAMGLRDSQMIAILIMAGSPTTVACYIMAKNMKADGILTANAVLLSTLLSAPSLTFWLYLMRLWGWI